MCVCVSGWVGLEGRDEDVEIRLSSLCLNVLSSACRDALGSRAIEGLIMLPRFQSRGLQVFGGLKSYCDGQVRNLYGCIVPMEY